MKKIYPCLLLLAFSTAAQSQPGKLMLTGSFERTPAVERVMFFYEINGKRISDTVRVLDGHYAYQHALPAPVLAQVAFYGSGPIRQWKGNGMRNYGFPVYLQPGKMELKTTDSVQQTRVTGSVAHDHYTVLEAARKPFTNEMSRLGFVAMMAEQKGDTLVSERASGRADSLRGVLYRTVIQPFLDRNPGSPLAIDLLAEYLDAEPDPTRFARYLAALPPAERNSENGKRLATYFRGRMLTAPGKMAPAFSQADSSGKAVSLASFRGKWVLVDFWASWCGPCRGENPNVVAAFRKYQEKNFTVLGVSLDEEKGRWLEAVRKDGLQWTQLCDLRGWKNAAAQLYGVQSIPFNVLIDPNGRIVAVNLRGSALQRKLEEVLP